MSASPFIVSPLQNEVRAGFDCGVAALNRYFLQQVTQDIKRRVATCFIAIERKSKQIAGYYTLSACHIHLGSLGEDWRKKLPLYPVVPAARLGRLAIDVAFQKQQLGAAMLYDAALRAYNSDIGATLLVVDAKDENAARFYAHHGFRHDPEDNMRLFAPLKSLVLENGK